MTGSEASEPASEAPAPTDPFERAALGPLDLYLLAEGTHLRLGDKLGAHPRRTGAPATRFAVWAPNATAVSVVHDENGWTVGRDPLEPVGSSGVWAAVVDGVGPGTRYKYAITARDGTVRLKADPVAAYAERPPATASVVWDLDHVWHDDDWMRGRGARAALDAPVAIYELHLGSWRRDPADPHRMLSYGELAGPLIEHVTATGFTHVELLPVMEHPYTASWGYQVTGYFAPTARHGSPQDLMDLIDQLHQAGIGVILDWVPSHFPLDEHGLARFDGTHLYEHADPRQGFHPDWQTAIFNLDRHEVRAFLLSSAHHWLAHFHVDGLRVDAVASMLYLDYSRQPGEWVPNVHGGRENLGAVSLLRELNTTVYAEHPGVQTFAEESTAWPQVSWPVDGGGLGFGYKWDMGWMHDTLAYLQREAVHRRWHHHELTFRSIYADSEHFVLPLSHDEVVHGKGSLLGKMPGDDWQQRATLRLLYGYQWATPGKKLLFMGGELAQRAEWDVERSLDWHLLDDPAHAGVLRLVTACNRWYRALGALHRRDGSPGALDWVLADDAERSLYAFVRRGHHDEVALVVVNATPVPRPDVVLGVPCAGRWRVVVNSDRRCFGGSGWRMDGRPDDGQPGGDAPGDGGPGSGIPGGDTPGSIPGSDAPGDGGPGDGTPGGSALRAATPQPETVVAVAGAVGGWPAGVTLSVPPLSCCWLVPEDQLPREARS